jgi:pimeloyl-ACP methyl ester carboxylesterase
MNMIIQPALRPTQRPRVIALHCSGANADQWRNLTEVLSGEFDVLAPEHFGSERRGPWPGEHGLSLADEAARTIAMIDESAHETHVVGHSYGGGVALNVALSRPCRIASMVLYEPSTFHLLRQMDERGAEAHAEIVNLAQRVNRGVVTGEYRDSIATFADYWNGSGAWNAMRPDAQEALVRWVPKGPLDFQALLNDATPPSAYSALHCPVLIIRGEHAPGPSRIIAECLSELLPNSRLEVVAGAGHMGPLTHAPQVSALVTRHIIKAEVANRIYLRALSR